MERLTERSKTGTAFFDDDGVLIRGAGGAFHQKKDMTANFIHRRFVALDKTIDRLAAYEDTGLEPEDIEALRDREQGLAELLVNVSCGCAVSYARLEELAQAEKDGRLVVLPCKVGDTIWTNFAMSGWHFRGKDKPYSARVVFIGLNDSDAMGRGLINVEYGKRNHMMQFPLSDIGKTVFLTREEAEAELKKREEETT